MGVVIPQVVTEDRASGAQVIDGGLVFDGGSTQYLEKTFASEGNRQSWTWSGWVKKQKITNDRMVLFGGYSAGSDTGWIELGYDDDKFYYTQNSVAGQSTEVFRDTSAWQHVVINYNGSYVVFYSNGEQIYSVSKTGDLGINSAGTHRIGRSPSGNTRYFYGQITNSYFIDGQALTPSNFGFTDGLTNTWRPKKYSGTFGANGFYLPMDGNTPVGFDESGNRNDFTPVNFGGTVGLDKATGGLPILNTNGGGTVAHVGVRTDAYASSLEAALPLLGVANDVSDLVNSANTARTVTVSGAVASSAQSNFYSGSFLFDGNDYLSVPASSDFNLLADGTFTIEFFFYTSALSGGYADYVGIFNGATAGILIYEQGGYFDAYINGAQRVSSTHPGAGNWHHAALTRDGTTLRLFVDGVLKDSSTASLGSDHSGPLQIGGASGRVGLNGYIQDVRVYKGVAKYTSNFRVASTKPDILPDTPSGVATKTKLTKINEGSVAFDGTGDYLSLSYSSDFVLDGDFTIECFVYYVTGSVMVDFSRSGSYENAWQLYNQYPVFYGYSSGGNAVMTSATPLVKGWNHLVVTRTISNNTARMFINGVQTVSSTSFSHTYGNDTSNVLSVGAQSYSGPTAYFTGHISNLRIIKGTALYTSNFTPPTEPLTNVTNTKLLCCHDPLSAVGSIVTPGNITANGDASATNFNPFNTDVNTIQGQETTYATLNPLDKNGSASISNGSSGNLDMGNSQGSSAWGTVRATIGASSGKFYAEYTCTGSSGGFRQTVGVVSLEVPNGTSVGSNVALNNLSDSAAYFNNGQKSLNGSTSSYGASWTVGDVVGIALDVDETSVTFFVNGVSQGVASSALASDASLTFGGGTISSNETGTWNFGQKPFKFTPPDGFQPLTGSSIRPETVVPNPDQYVGVTTYTGNGTGKTISDLGFKPDFVWVKNRDAATSNYLMNTVLGVEYIQISEQTSGGGTFTNRFGAVTPNGFTVKTMNGVNDNGVDYVGWAWKAGGQIGIGNSVMIDDVAYANATAAGLTDGDNTITGASVGTKQGFSIVSGTQGSGVRTIDHGLNAKPDFILMKRTSGSSNWFISHVGLTNQSTKFLYFTTATETTNANWFNSTAPTSSVITMKASGMWNEGEDFVVYSWRNVPGLQKFGTYTGNGSTDGPMVETGFSPRIVWTKASGGSGGNWSIYDTARSENNVAPERLYANTDSAEESSAANMIDILSNGFKLRHSNAQTNGSGTTYIYCAWAAAPAFNMFGASSNAR